MNPTRNDLPQELREKIIAMLNARLADCIDLSLQAKQAHWNVKGTSFIALHELFDEIEESLGEFSDTIAERAVALGGTAMGTLQAVASASQLSAYPTAITSGRDHCDHFSAGLAAFGKAVRADSDEAGDLGDADTADLFTEVSRGIDKHLWFVEAHLQE